MKYLNFEECIDVLKKAGGVLKIKEGVRLVHIKNGKQCDCKTGYETNFNFSNRSWSEHKGWREELKGKKTLCYVWNKEEQYEEEQYKIVACVTGYAKGQDYPFKTGGYAYSDCKRMTKAEIAVYLDNAPDVEDVD